MRSLGVFICALMLFVYTALAQPLQLTLMMSPNPSPYLSDWEQRKETVLLSITNPQQNPFAVRIRARVFQGGPTGTLLAETKLEDMPILQIMPGSSIFDGGQIVPADAVKFYGNVEGNAARTGRLPGGQYTLCVDLVDAELGQVLSQQKCAGFFITLHLPPQLYNPQNNAALTLNQLRTEVFRWSKESPPVTNSRAEFVVVEYRDGQPLWQTLSANIPVLQTDVMTGLTQLQWPPDLMLQEKKYVWSVRIVDDQRHAATEPEWAEPFLFTVMPDSATKTPDNTTSICTNPSLKLSVSGGVGTPEYLQPFSFTTGIPQTRSVDASAISLNWSCSFECKHHYSICYDVRTLHKNRCVVGQGVSKHC